MPGAWGERNNYEIFVQGGAHIASKNVKIPRGMLEYVAGMAGKVISGIADHDQEAGDGLQVMITITGDREGLQQATFIMANIVKTNMHKLNLSASASAALKKDKEKEKEQK